MNHHYCTTIRLQKIINTHRTPTATPDTLSPFTFSTSLPQLFTKQQPPSGHPRIPLAAWGPHEPLPDHTLTTPESKSHVCTNVSYSIQMAE